VTDVAGCFVLYSVCLPLRGKKEKRIRRLDVY